MYIKVDSICILKLIGNRFNSKYVSKSLSVQKRKKHSVGSGMGAGQEKNSGPTFAKGSLYYLEQFPPSGPCIYIVYL